MNKWPLPNLKLIKFSDAGINDRGGSNKNSWFREKDKANLNPILIPDYFPRGWNNPWPDLPIPDADYPDFNLDNIRLSEPRNRCANQNLLGYYISWHIVGISFQNEMGQPPSTGDELKEYNDNLPEENRFGIHICCSTISDYINKFNTDGLEKKLIPFYLEYCTFLTMIYVIAHEWGHYRSETLSFQITNLVKAVTGDDSSSLSPSYLSYFIFKKQYPESNFEEVFAEWASLKTGIFNYFMKKPEFANDIPNWPLVETTVKFMLTEAISRPNRVKPYSDIRFWVNFSKISSNKIMERLSSNSSSLNRSVNDNLHIKGVKSFKKGKIIDLLMHNQMQFSEEHIFNGLIKSAPKEYPLSPDSLFYHFGDDEGLLTNKTNGNSDKQLKLGNLDDSDPFSKKYPIIKKVIDGLKEEDNSDEILTPKRFTSIYSSHKEKSDVAVLPIKVFDEILPLDPVYFHA